MSQENVELVRRVYDAYARRDDATAFEAYAEDIVWDLSNSRRAALFVKPVYHGHEGLREAWRETLAAFSEIDFEVEEVIDVGDQVLVAIRESVVGRASGAPAETTHVVVWTLAEGKVTQLQVFDERLPALEAVGLSE